jgi:hypothetical protein
MGWEDRPVWEPNAAGIDVGAREMFVAVHRAGRPPGAGVRHLHRDPETYKLFGVDVTQIPGLEENALPWFSARNLGPRS